MRRLVIVASFDGFTLYDITQSTPVRLPFHSKETGLTFDVASPLIGYKDGELVYDPMWWQTDELHQNFMLRHVSFGGYRYENYECLDRAIKVLISYTPRKVGNTLFVSLDFDFGQFISAAPNSEFYFDRSHATKAKELGLSEYVISSSQNLASLFLWLVSNGLDIRRNYHADSFLIVDGGDLYIYKKDSLDPELASLYDFSSTLGLESLTDYEKKINAIYMLPFHEGNMALRATKIRQVMMSFGQANPLQTKLDANFMDQPQPFGKEYFQDQEPFKEFLLKRFESMLFILKCKLANNPNAVVMFSLRSKAFYSYCASKIANKTFLAAPFNDGNGLNLDRGRLFAAYMRRYSVAAIDENQNMQSRLQPTQQMLADFDKSHEIKLWSDTIYGLFNK